MLAKDIMTADVVTVSPDARVEDIAELLLRRGISGVPVVGKDGKVVGIVSEGDLIRRSRDDEDGRSWWLKLFGSPEDRARDYRKSHGRRAEDVMTTPVISIREDTPVGEIAQLLEQRRIKRVPVLRDGKVVGLISRANILHGLATHKDRFEVPATADDRGIRKAVQELVRTQGWITHGSLNVLVTDGVVELWGWVDSEDERKALMSAVAEIPGVTEVTDHLASLPPYLRTS